MVLRHARPGPLRLTPDNKRMRLPAAYSVLCNTGIGPRDACFPLCKAGSLLPCAWLLSSFHPLWQTTGMGHPC